MSKPTVWRWQERYLDAGEKRAKVGDAHGNAAEGHRAHRAAESRACFKMKRCEIRTFLKQLRRITFFYAARYLSTSDTPSSRRLVSKNEVILSYGSAA